MKRSFVAGGLVLAAVIATFSFGGAAIFGGLEVADPAIDPAYSPPANPEKTMPAFRSGTELRQAFKKVQQKRQRAQYGSSDGASANTTAAPAPTSVAKSAADDSKPDGESITNNQVAGVDEGGIVKTHGDHLVILRRGRLFTVEVGGDELDPVSSINAYPPGVNPSSDWYDEMLVSGNTIIVVGYSYSRGGTEINLFDIDREGGLSYRSSYHLKSNDYYSARNYASRLIGNKLVFYTPQYLGWANDPMQSFPAFRKWRRGATNDDFKTVVEPTNVYRAERPMDKVSFEALHTVTVCDLSQRDVSCKGTAIVGAPGRVFYVAKDSVYVWTSDWSYGSENNKSDSMLYRMPLDGSAPSAICVSGSPVDQFSFHESSTDQLNVLVRSNSNGDAMWESEEASGDVALFRLSTSRFSDGSQSASKESYLNLPNVEGYTFQNRFVGDYVLYGSGNGWGGQKKADGTDLFAVNWKVGRVTNLAVEHSVDRIEPLGNAAVVVGTNGVDLYFSPVSLGSRPSVRPSYIREKASQGELRSHGFFYKPENRESGILGLPIARQGRAGHRHLTEGSAAVLFLKNNGLRFDQVGELGSRDASTNDGCKASCVDWYGNARPIFLRGRIFALMGYEIVEGSLDGGQMREVRRTNYSPRSLTRFGGEEEE